ncbi:VOC family protein [Stutzerimonas stutzeri]|uniref:VOC family protein n=1 Tax=Stutzerimonas stutzeri TaxID=316 RepID=UPI003C7048AE
MACRIDHITITAPSLSKGSDLVYESLGVRPQQGGEHPRMGTHNLLLRLGDSIFLEVIAINHAAARTLHARWFHLDALPPDAPPRLACWVARTPSIHESTSAATEPLGPPSLCHEELWNGLCRSPKTAICYVVERHLC